MTNNISDAYRVRVRTREQMRSFRNINFFRFAQDRTQIAGEP